MNNVRNIPQKLVEINAEEVKDLLVEEVLQGAGAPQEVSNLQTYCMSNNHQH